MSDDTSDDRDSTTPFWLLLVLLITHVGACVGGVAIARLAWP